MLGRSRTAPWVVAVALGATLVTATATAVAGFEPSGVAATRAAGAELLDPLEVSGTVVPEGQVAPSPLPAAPAEVAPLGELRSPDLVVTLPAPLSGEQLQALQGIEQVAGVTVLDAGAVDLAGAPVRLVGVDPSDVRHYLPQETAASDPLWQSVARGELAASYALANERQLPLGESVPAGPAAVPARIGAVAAFGLPGVDVVTTREVARSLGAAPDTVVVVSAPELGIDVLRRRVAAVVGEAQVEVLRPAVAESTGKPRNYRELYIDSARYCPGLRWQVLAAIGQVESGHGRNLGPSSAGALGPMQFLPSTWAAYGVDGDGDGVKDILNPFDAVPGAANYLCRSGANRGEAGLYDAIFAYNHADWYVQKVLALAAQYE